MPKGKQKSADFFRNLKDEKPKTPHQMGQVCHKCGEAGHIASGCKAARREAQKEAKKEAKKGADEEGAASSSAVNSLSQVPMENTNADNQLGGQERSSRKQPHEVSKLIALLQPKLDKGDLKKALLQVKGLVDRIYTLEEEVHRLTNQDQALQQEARPPSRIDSLVALPTECLIAILGCTSIVTRRAACTACMSLALAVKDGRARRLWSEGD